MTESNGKLLVLDNMSASDLEELERITELENQLDEAVDLNYLISNETREIINSRRVNEKLMVEYVNCVGQKIFEANDRTMTMFYSSAAAVVEGYGVEVLMSEDPAERSWRAREFFEGKIDESRPFILPIQMEVSEDLFKNISDIVEKTFGSEA